MEFCAACNVLEESSLNCVFLVTDGTILQIVLKAIFPYKYYFIFYQITTLIISLFIYLNVK